MIKGLPALPRDIPASPSSSYMNSGWVNWGDWLGTGTVAPFNRRYKSYVDARAFVHSLRLRSAKEWTRYCQGRVAGKPAKPEDIPIAAWHVYRDRGWSGFGDWLGTGATATYAREYRPFAEAREFVHSLRLLNSDQWRAYCRGSIPNLPALPLDIPAAVQRVYRGKGWKGMRDWLGTR
jgi:hypothetical protein